jgi:hypothetical protein
MNENLIAVIPLSWQGRFSVRYDPEAAQPHFIRPVQTTWSSLLTWALIGGGILVLLTLLKKGD